MTMLLGTFSVSQLGRLGLLRGIGSVMDLRGNTRRQYRFARTPAEADLRAIASDWDATGCDMQAALDDAARERLAR